MLGTLKITLRTEEKITYNKSSLFHGVIMEQIDPEYAMILHESQLKPFSQNLRLQDGKLIWTIHALNEEAYEKILVKLISPQFQVIHLEHNNLDIEIEKKELSTTDYKTLVETYYFENCSNRIPIHLNTPMAFKQNGRYVFGPDIRLLYHSILNRFDSFSKDYEMYSEEVLEQLVDYTEIVQYNIRSTYFYLEGVKIPSYIGEIVLRVRGPQQLVNLANLLFRYAEFSGIGVKSALGMGAIEIKKKGEKHD